VSTHLYHSQRLCREHLLEIRAHGFERVEIVATRTHVDYHNPAAVADVQQWLAEAGVELESVHAPVAGEYQGGRWIGPWSLASADRAQRELAVAEAERALQIARRVAFRVLVVHLGWPRPAENSRDAARRSVEALAAAAEPLGVTIAVEVLQNELSRAPSLAHFVEEMLDEARVRICLDFGHAHADGDLVDAIETVSEHLAHVHIHDNHGRADEHLVPFDGTIEWPAALTELQKVGYDGTFMFEVSPKGSAADTLKKASRARERMERLLA
jgi:sugar phosphate isomerase/epimerase